MTKDKQLYRVEKINIKNLPLKISTRPWTYSFASCLKLSSEPSMQFFHDYFCVSTCWREFMDLSQQGGCDPNRGSLNIPSHFGWSLLTCLHAMLAFGSLPLAKKRTLGNPKLPNYYIKWKMDSNAMFQVSVSHL
jgi:hypothetical protein